jgi:prepilin-type N-terminal cleavage/methylation domain-containing protein
MKRKQRGFTLLELLLTLTVTTIGLVGLLSLHLSIARGNDLANRSAEAASIGNAALEQLRAARIPDMMQLLTGSPTSTPPVNINFGTVAGRNNMTFRRQVKVTQLNNASTSLWLIRVEVGWTEDGATQGADSGTLDHMIASEVVRTVEEAL